MRLMTWLLVASWLLSVIGQTSVVSANEYMDNVTGVELGSTHFTQQELVAFMDMALPLYSDSIDHIDSLKKLKFILVSEQLEIHIDHPSKIIELNSAYEYFEESAMRGPWGKGIPFERHIFFSGDNKIIGEYVRFQMDNHVDVELALNFMAFVEIVARDNFGYVSHEICPPDIEVWDYKFSLNNDYGDELEFSWYGPFISVVLRAGDLRPKSEIIETAGLFMLSPYERYLYKLRH